MRYENRDLTDRGDQQQAALVGPWEGMADDADHLSLSGLTVVRCPEGYSGFKRSLVGLKPEWLVVSCGLEDRTIRHMMYCAQAVVTAVRVAVLVRQDVPASYERWLRHGAQALAPASVTPDRLAALLRTSALTDVIVIDGDLSWRNSTPPVVPLTVREEEVLRLIRQGLTNEEIGDELNLTRSTIQFHVGNMLVKLAARNRVGIVARADQLGL